MNIKKLIALFIVVIMCTGILFACSNANQKNKANEKETQSTGNENVLSPKEDGPLVPYDPEITVTSHLSSLDPTIKFTETETPEDNVWTRAYKNDLGIKVEYLWTANSEQGTEKMNLAIASNNLPDIMRVNRMQFEQLVQAGKLADIKDAYEKLAGSFIKETMSRPGGEEAMKVVSRDGKMYALPYFLNCTDDTKNIWIRYDWLKKLNLPEPKTLDDVIEIARAFTTKDPDGNGQNDTYGFVMHKDSLTYSGLATFFNCYHAYPGIWIKDDQGKLINGVTVSERMKPALQKLNELYKEGVINKAFGSLDWSSNILEDLMNNKVGIVFGGLWEGWWPLGEMKVADPNVEWKSYPVLSIDDKPAKAQSMRVLFNGFNVVRSDFEHPEVLIKMANLCVKYMWESDAETFAKYGYDSAGNNPWLLCPVYFEAPGKNHTLYLKTVKALDTGDTSDLNGEEQLIYGWMKDYLNGDMSRYGIYLSYGHDSSCAKMEHYLNNDLYMLDEFYGNPTESMLEKNTILEKLFQEYGYKIIIGELPVDSYDEFVEEWYKQGGEDITNEVNEWYNSIN